MSLTRYCDWCDALMHTMFPSTTEMPSKWRHNAHQFCSENCLQKHVITFVLHESADDPKWLPMFLKNEPLEYAGGVHAR